LSRMGLGSLPGDVLCVVGEFLEVSVCMDDDGIPRHEVGDFFEARKTCPRLSRSFLVRPSKLSIEGACEESRADLLLMLLGSVDSSRVLHLKSSFLDDASLRHVLRLCTALRTLEVFAGGDEVRRRPEVLLVPSLRHLFVNELPSRALARGIAGHPGLELFAWNVEMDNWCDELGYDDLQDEDLDVLAPLADEIMAQRIFPGNNRLYDLSFDGASVSGLRSFCKKCRSLSALRTGDYPVCEKFLEVMDMFMEADVRPISLELYETRRGGVDDEPFLKVVKRDAASLFSMSLKTANESLSREMGCEEARFVASEIGELVSESLDVQESVATVIGYVLAGDEVRSEGGAEGSMDEEEEEEDDESVEEDQEEDQVT
jgi:hypothetical protein